MYMVRRYYNLKCFNLKTRQGRLYPGLGSVTAIEEKDSTSMWIGTSTNLFLLDRNSGKYHEIPLPGGATTFIRYTKKTMVYSTLAPVVPDYLLMIR